MAWPAAPFRGGDAAAYDERLARIAEAMKPEDIFVELWARDIADLDWEVSRLRRLQASLMTAAAHEGLQRILEPLLESFPDQVQLVRAWSARDKAAIKRVDELLASAGLTMDAVMAQTLCTYLDEFERIARMIASAEARRDAILHEVVQHRGRRGLRRVTQQATPWIEGHRG